MALAMSACSTPATPLTDSQLAARQINREQVIATSAINVAYGVMQTPGLSPAVIADIKAGAYVVAGGVSVQIAVAQSGGSALSQAAGGVSGGLQAAVPALGKILTSAHGSTATTEEVSMSAGLSAFSQAPAIAVLIADELDGAWVPSSDTLKSNSESLAEALANVQAYGNPPMAEK